MELNLLGVSMATWSTMSVNNIEETNGFLHCTETHKWFSALRTDIAETNSFPTENL